jgi:hypothetical protein
MYLYHLNITSYQVFSCKLIIHFEYFNSVQFGLPSFQRHKICRYFCTLSFCVINDVKLCSVLFRKAEDGSIFYGGWARMAQPIINFAVVEVAKPNIGKQLTLELGSFQGH